MAGPYTQGMSFLPDDPWEMNWAVPETPVAETEPPLRGTFNALDELYPALRGTISPDRETPRPEAPPTRRDGTILTRALEDLFFNPMEVGLTEAGRDFRQTAAAVWGKDYQRPAAPKSAELTSVDELLTDPRSAGQKMMTQAFRFAPTMVGAIVGGAVAAPAAGTTAAGAGLAQLGGMSVGAMIATLGQSWGINLDAAVKANPSDPDQAYLDAVAATAIDTGFAGFGTVALAANPFSSVLKNMVLQTVATQPAIGVAGSRAHQAVTGQDAGLSLADEYLNVTGPSVMMAGLGALPAMSHPALTPRAAAEPWTLPWSKTGEDYEIDPAIAAAVPEEGGPGAQDHPAARFGAAMQRVEKPIEAWHGSPHDFDEFRMSQNLGRGEGNTAFGEGGYFGEERQTGETYRQSLTDTHRSPDVKTKNARVPRWLANRIAARADKAEAIAEARRDFEARVAEAKAEAPDNIQPWMAEQQVPNLMEVLRGIDDIEKHGVPDLKGKLYNVNLHLKPEQVVDWDAPIAEQPDIVRKLAKGYQPPDQQKPPRDALAVIKAALKEAEGLPSQDHVALIIDNDQRLHEAAWAHAKAVLPKQQYLTMEAHGDSIGNWLARRHGGFIEREGFGARSGGELLGLMEAKHGRAGTAKLLRDAGMRGIRYLDQLSRVVGEKKTRNYVVFHDEDVEIKAKFQRGIGDNKPPEAMEPFYYKSERLLPTLAAKAPAKQWEATLRNKGVKAEELEDLGIADFLKSAGDTVVTREQVQALIDANRAEFKEVNYTDADPQKLKAFDQRLEEIQDRFNELGGVDTVPAQIERARLSDEQRDLSRQRNLLDAEQQKATTRPKFATYTLPGGKNYREIVVTLPDQTAQRLSARRREIEGLGARATPEQRQEWADIMNQLRPDDRDIEGISKFQGRPEYRSPHWQDVPNVLFHNRVSDRTGADGARLLHMEEGQGDVYNEGRAKGYKPADIKEQIATKLEQRSKVDEEWKLAYRHQAYMWAQAREFFAKAKERHPPAYEIWDRGLNKVIWRGEPGGSVKEAFAKARELGAGPSEIAPVQATLPEAELTMHRQLQEAARDYDVDIVQPLKKRYEELNAEIGSLRTLSEEGVWSAPFKKSWSELMMKRMVKYAAENGYDRLIWTPGEEQAKRFRLDQHLEELMYWTPDDGKTWNIVAIPKGSDLGDAQVVRNIPTKELDRHIGKETANKLVDRLGPSRQSYDLSDAGVALPDTEGQKIQSLRGTDLKIVDQGKRTFYDQIIPTALKKLGAKHGAVVGKEKIETGNLPGGPKFEGLPETADAVREIVRNDPGYKREHGNEVRAQIADYINRLDNGEQQLEASRSLGEEAGKYLGGTVSGKHPVKTTEVHSFTLTPELKRSVLGEGQPMYQRGGDAEGGAMQPAFISKVSLTPEQLKRHAPLLREFAAAIKVMAPDAKFLPVMNLIETAETGGKAKHRGATVLPDTAIGTLIVVALEGADGFNSKAFGTVGHEVVHALKLAGVFGDPKDFSSPWAVMEAAAKKQNWIAKHRIEERYRDLDDAGRLEEAIAEEVGEYLRGGRNAAHPPLLRKALGRFSDGLRKIKLAIEKFFGKDVSAQEVMERIASGEMGWKRAKKAAAGAEPRFQVSWDPDALKARYAVMGRDELLAELERRNPALARMNKNASMKKMREELFADDVSTERTKNELKVSEDLVKKHGGEPWFQRAPAVDTPEFKRWFGKSKVLEPGGEPKVVYHGTNEDFDRFARTNDLGYHFGTAEQAEARLAAYGSQYDPASKDYISTGGRVLPMYLKIENPLRLPDLGTWETEGVLLNLRDRGVITEKEYDAFINGPEVDPVDVITSKGYDGVVYRNAGEATRTIEPRDLVGATLNKTDAGPFGWEVLNSYGDRIGLGKTPEDAMLHAKEQVGGDKKTSISIPTGDSYIVFDPRQVKSVFNAGGFDPKQKSFMLQNAAEPTTKSAEAEVVAPPVIPKAAPIRPEPEKKEKPAPEGTVVKKGGKRYLVTKDPETGQRTVEVLED